MLVNTSGIVIHTMKYADSGLICKIYTENNGLTSYLVKGVTSSKSRMPPSYFMPLNILEMITYIKPNRNLQGIKEVKLKEIWHTIHTDVARQSICQFLSEFLYKTIKEEGGDKKLFEFLLSGIRFLNNSYMPISNFHLSFLAQLTQFMGFFPDLARPDDILNPDNKTIEDKGHSTYSSALLCSFFESSFEEAVQLKTNSQQRESILDVLIHYYRIHLNQNFQLSSHKILKQVFSEI